MMSIDEAIAHARAEEELQRKYAKEIRKRTIEAHLDYGEAEEQCAEYHEQIAEWLEELKDCRDKNKIAVRIDVENLESVTNKAIELAKEQYNKAIDDFTEKIIRYVDCGHLCSPTEIRWSDLAVVEMVKKLAEQLKAGDG